MSLWDLVARRNDEHGLGHCPTSLQRLGGGALPMTGLTAGSCGAPLSTLLDKNSDPGEE